MPSLPTAEVVPHIVQYAQTKADKLEKARQKVASLKYTNIYAYLGVGIISFFILRNLILLAHRHVAERRARKALASEKPASGAGSVLYGQKPVLLRISDRIDDVLLTPVNCWAIPSHWTYLRLFLFTLIFAINVAFCLVISVNLITPNTAGSSLPRAFSRRCGRMAVANYPFLFMFAGRNNIIARLTGFSYQELRFYHIMLGTIAFIQSFIHTFAYIAHFTIYQGVDKLAEDFTETYFKWGIVAVVFMATNCFFGIRWIRRRSYEIFLALHVIGAALILAGSWYHRPVIEDWVTASAVIWAFERFTRVVLHFASVVHTRLIVRKPVIRAKASVCNGAIKLSVPFPSGEWKAGKHAYISFWGLDLLRRPHLYGQSHPFSISNMPSETVNGQQELRFVLRIHGGITKELANHIERKSTAKGVSKADCLVSIEGPHGEAPQAEHFDSVLLIAGGSGITHPLSILSSVCCDAVKGNAVTSNVKLCWALQRYEQTSWVEETVNQARADADAANLPLAVDLYVTRSASPASSGTSTPTVEFDEKKHDFGEQTDFAGKARRFSGRPDLAQEISRAVSESAGRTLIVACGPDALAEEVRQASSQYLTSCVEVQIAKFEC
ncbi:hypothetical protein JCM8547_009278 [Rhodosporidiobolus lusitaniae]